MANHRSAEKRARQNIKRAARNTAVRSRVKTAIRAFRESLAKNDQEEIKQALSAACRELRKAATKGVLHKRNASRHVSRLQLAYNAKVAA